MSPATLARFPNAIKTAAHCFWVPSPGDLRCPVPGPTPLALAVSQYSARQEDAGGSPWPVDADALSCVRRCRGSPPARPAARRPLSSRQALHSAERTAALPGAARGAADLRSRAAEEPHAAAEARRRLQARARAAPGAHHPSAHRLQPAQQGIAAGAGREPAAQPGALAPAVPGQPQRRVGRASPPARSQLGASLLRPAAAAAHPGPAGGGQAAAPAAPRRAQAAHRPGAGSAAAAAAEQQAARALRPPAHPRRPGAPAATQQAGAAARPAHPRRERRDAAAAPEEHLPGVLLGARRRRGALRTLAPPAQREAPAARQRPPQPIR